MSRKRFFIGVGILISVAFFGLGCEAFGGSGDGFGDPTSITPLDHGDLYEAENRTNDHACEVSRKHSGYTGKGYINYGDKGAWIEFDDIEVELAGEYTLTFRYANGRSSGRSSVVKVNGKAVGTVPFGGTGGWTRWGKNEIVVTLRQGTNAIRVEAETSRGGPNLDHMVVTASDLCPGDPDKTEPGQCGCGVSEGACGAGKNLPYHETFDSLGGAFECNKDSCFWTSEKINTSKTTSLEIAADASCREVGQFEGADYLKMSYRIDGGAWKSFFSRTDDFQPLKVDEAVAGVGDSLEIRIQAKTSASNETYIVDDLIVRGINDDPQPGDCKESEGCYEIAPSGNSDDTALIQNALDNLNKGETLMLKGDFVYKNTIYLPSNFTWILDGTLTLAKYRSGELDRVGIKKENFNNKRATGIATRPGSTGIDMSGGTYLGNGDFNKEQRVRLLNFVWAEDSEFHDMVVEDASDDCFTLGHESRSNVVRNVIARYAGGKVSRNGGNGLSDYGDGNKWYDCIAEDCGSDGWTPKCKNSEFYRCISRRNDGPGFGCYVRLDGSPVDNSMGTSVDGNKFIDIQSYDNAREGISFNITDNSGPGSTIRNNIVTGVFYNNGMFGALFRNKLEEGIIENNQVDILAFDNDAVREDGGLIKRRAGLTVEGDVKGLTGSVVAYDNANGDIGLDDATGCSLTVYNPIDESPADVDEGSSSNDVDFIDLDCSQSQESYAAKAYCKTK